MVEVSDNVVRVSENGVSRPPRRLTPDRARQLRELAARVIGGTNASAGASEAIPSDSLLTELEVYDQGMQRTLELRSGDDASDEVWELLDGIGEASSGR
jgi:hypothetical protein